MFRSLRVASRGLGRGSKLAALGRSSRSALSRKSTPDICPFRDKLVQCRAFGNDADLINTPPNAPITDPRQLGKWIAWLCFNRFGTQALVELRQSIEVDPSILTKLPASVGWHLTRGLLEEGALETLEALFLPLDASNLQSTNPFLAVFDVQCFNLLLLHYATKPNLRQAQLLFSRMITGIDGGRIKANYVSVILYMDMLDEQGVPERSVLGLDFHISAIRSQALIAVEQWMIALHELRYSRETAKWIKKYQDTARAGKHDIVEWPVHFSPAAGTAALLYFCGRAATDSMIEFASLIDKRRRLTLVEITVVARELELRSHQAAPQWAQRLMTGEDPSGVEQRDRILALFTENHERFFSMHKAAKLYKNDVTVQDFENLSLQLFFDDTPDAAAELAKMNTVVMDALALAEGEKKSVYTCLVQTAKDRGMVISDYAFVKAVRVLVDRQATNQIINLFASLFKHGAVSSFSVRAVLYSIALTVRTSMTRDYIQRLEHWARRDQATLLAPTVLTMFMRAYRSIRSPTDFERLWMEFIEQRNVVPNSSMLELWMFYLLSCKRYPALQALWAKVMSREYGPYPSMSMYDIMIQCYCHCFNYPAIENTVAAMLEDVKTHGYELRPSGSLLMLLKLCLQTGSNVEWAEAVWETFTSEPLRAPTYEIPSEAMRMMLLIYLRGAGVARAIDWAESCHRMAVQGRATLAAGFTTSFLAEILIVQLGLTDPKELVRLSGWADTTGRNGLLKPLSAQQLEDFPSLIAKARELLTNEARVSEPAPASVAAQHSPPSEPPSAHV